MSTFKGFSKAVNKQLEKMSKGILFTVHLDKGNLWDLYLNSFPEGTNPIYLTNTEHDCNCCKSFIRTLGNVVAYVDGKLETIWDIEVEGFYQEVANALSDYVKGYNIHSIFLHDEARVGAEESHKDSGEGVITFNHFHFDIPNCFITHKDSIRSKVGKARTNKNVLERSLNEITKDSVEVVLELIAQNSLYRGEEHKELLESVLRLKREYAVAENKEQYLWIQSQNLGGMSSIRNTVIGTLLLDLSNGVDLEDAVGAFEHKVAPQNYKRPTALITKGMISKAEAKVQELGIEDSLHRRFAVTEDITINNVLFADRSAKATMGVFDDLVRETKDNVPNLDKVQEVSIDDFMDNVLPKADSLELYLDNKHSNNFVSLVAPTEKDAKGIFKWGNNFSWSYNGEVTDSIKERVKNAGGDVTGYLRCSLSWFNYDDLDLHVIEPCGNVIYFSSKYNPKTKGNLDVDMNAGSGESRKAVENITWPSKNLLQEGVYVVKVHNYCKRESKDVGFELELELNGDVYNFTYDKPVKDGKKVNTIKFEYSHSNGIKLLESIESTTISKEIWGINTQKFHKVDMVMNSPNHWDGEKTGNKHWFFMLENCVNPEKARGFYNEFLSNELTEHRKVFEVLSSKLKTEESGKQLSGLGFSSTQSSEVLCRVKGAFNRLVKIKF